MSTPSQSVSSSTAAGEREQPDQPFTETRTTPSLGFCRALYDYDAPRTGGQKLSFRTGDIIEILGKQPSGWWDGLILGRDLGEDQRGWFPSNYVVVLPPEDEV